MPNGTPPARPRRRLSAVGHTVVDVQHREGRIEGDVQERREQSRHLFDDHPARVRVEGSVTQNMGDFNSVRVGVMIDRPCVNTDEAIEETYNEISGMVDRLLAAEIDLATGGR
ncbi:hypothetical protein H10PHJ05_83 [Aeromonas phage HJ05]|nr:hypothetical protein H10PHJ05_83 [Aeromonas phage HJ05]